MAKIIVFRKRKGKLISQLKSWQHEKKVFILQMKKSPDGAKHCDQLAAEQLGIKLTEFCLITTKGTEKVWGIQGSRKRLEPLKVRIGKAAYEIAKANGTAIRRGRELKERWHFVT
jgi:hypothetical protein